MEGNYGRRLDAHAKAGLKGLNQLGTELRRELQRASPKLMKENFSPHTPNVQITLVQRATESDQKEVHHF